MFIRLCLLLCLLLLVVRLFTRCKEDIVVLVCCELGLRYVNVAMRCEENKEEKGGKSRIM